jgi:hypothetical protein
MKKSCGLILSRREGPKERDTQRFTCQNGEAGTSEARLDRPGLDDHMLLFIHWCRGGANKFPADR